MMENWVKGGYIFCVLGHIESSEHIHRIFNIFLYFLSEYAKNPGGWAM
jgi:hypothetical protein